MKTKKSFIAIMLAIAIVAAPLLSAVSSAAVEQAIPKLTFSGIDISQAADGSYQAVYSLRLEGADVSMVGFTLTYDDTYLAPSNFDDNSLFSDVDLTGAFKEEGTPEQSALMELEGDIYFNIVHTTDAMTGSQEGGFLVGRFSFRLNDGALAQLNAMTQSDLMNLVALKTDSNQPLQAAHVDEEAYEGFVPYDDVRWVSRVEMKPSITKVTANITPGRETVTAQAIYQSGVETDLFQYVQSNSTSVTVTYLDGSTSVEPFTWDVADMALSPDGTTWNAQGGTFTATQAYLDTGFNVEAEIEVTPVSVLKFTPDPASGDYITYDVDTDPTCKPADISDAKLQFPQQATPDYDKLLVNGYTAAPVTVNNDWAQTDPVGDDFFADTAKGEYTFQATVDTTLLPAWATLPDDADVVEVKRFLGPPTATPGDITATVDDNGNLIITVGKLGDDAVPDGTKFFVRLPDGTDVTVNDSDIVIADGVATITIPNSAIPSPKTGQAINLGADTNAPFQIAAQITGDPAHGRSEFAPCTFDPRNNYYEKTTDGSDYTFDYTGLNKGKFPFVVGSTLSEEITLPGTDSVNTTYDGVTGADNGRLQTIKVDAWTLKSGDPNVEGSVLEYTGTLVDNTVTGFGDVKRPATAVTVTLKLQTVAAELHSVTLEMDPSDGSLGTLEFSNSALTNPADFTANDTVALKCVPIDGYVVTWTTVPAGIMITQDSTDETLFTFTMPNDDVTVTAKFVDSSTVNAGTLEFYGKTRDEPTEAVPTPPWADTLIDTLYTKNSFDDADKVTAFDPEVSEYWIRVGNDTEQFKIKMTTPTAGVTLLVYEPATDGSFPSLDSIDPATATEGTDGLLRKVTVTANDAPATDYSAAADEIPLAPAKAGSMNDFFVVMAGGTKAGYTVHVQRMAKAEIKLNYGNSPYGMIMADDAITDKATAKTAFITDGFRFTTENLPTGSSSNITYTTLAWGDNLSEDDRKNPQINKDLDENAIFVYNWEEFYDPGFIATDSFGNTVHSENITVSLPVKVMTTPGASGLANVVDGIVNSSLEDGRYQFDFSSDAFDFGVRPAVYKLTYTFIDSYLPENDANMDGKPDNLVSEVRHVIVLNTLGDTDNSQTLAPLDRTEISSVLSGRVLYTGVPDETMSLFRFRVMDADNSGSLAPLDGTEIARILGGGIPIRFYNALS